MPSRFQTDKTRRGEKREPVDVRGLRLASDALLDLANQERREQVRELGLEAYLAGVLGEAADLPAKECMLIYWNREEEVLGILDKTILEYLCYRAEKGYLTSLPEAILTPDGDKIYL
jgi:hypothetical protein